MCPKGVKVRVLSRAPNLMLAAAVGIALLFAPDAELDKKIESVLPSAGEELWMQIPWRANLHLARREAQEKGKPLFFWIMNGHPLGCT